MSNILGPDQTLKQGDSLSSSDQAYELRMQTDGNLVLYRKAGNQPLWNAWDSAQWKTPGVHPQPVHLTMEKDGNLVIYGPVGSLWETDTHGAETYSSLLVIQNDGNLVLYDFGPSK